MIFKALAYFHCYRDSHCPLIDLAGDLFVYCCFAWMIIGSGKTLRQRGAKNSAYALVAYHKRWRKRWPGLQHSPVGFMPLYAFLRQFLNHSLRQQRHIHMYCSKQSTAAALAGHTARIRRTSRMHELRDGRRGGTTYPTEGSGAPMDSSPTDRPTGEPTERGRAAVFPSPSPTRACNILSCQQST